MMKKFNNSFSLKRLFGSTVEARQQSVGYLFVLPWLIGISIFFIYPMSQAAVYLFNQVDLEPGRLVYTFAGWGIFNRVFMVDAENIRIIIESIQSTFVSAALILCFSLIIAVIINKPFYGRGFCRAILALPILVSSGVLMQVFKGDMFRYSIESSASATIFQSFFFEGLLNKMGLSWENIWAMSGIVKKLLDLIWQCGIQILIFVAGMQSIPSTYFEVCKVEGASPWQTFWKVTFPLITPFLTLNFVYAVIDSFTLYSNPVIIKINEYFKGVQYSYGTALAFVYFLVALILIGVIIKLLTKNGVYMEY
jgi:ABC-type sugar transport system permease subunit